MPSPADPAAQNTAAQMPVQNALAQNALALVCLHFLGGSARSYEAVAARLDPSLRLIALDLPGFGDAAGVPGHRVTEMASHVAERIRAELPDGAPFVLVGHSMGAKVAAVLARRAEDGEPALTGLCRLVLLAGSPPSPEPMPEAKRWQMHGWLGGSEDERRIQARQYIEDNIGAPLPGEPSLSGEAWGQAVADVLRLDRAAWRTWLETGSREDWSRTVGVLRTPALLIAGAEDEALGPAAQAGLAAPHYAHARLVTLAGAGHLLPLERPDEVARLILEHARSPEPAAPAAPHLSESYRALVASPRVNSRLREALTERERPDDPAYRPTVLDPVGLAVLRAVCARVMPQQGEGGATDRPIIDLAARIDTVLAGHSGSEGGDGWRPASMPPDAEAYPRALRGLDAVARLRHGEPFVRLDGPRQDALLEEAGSGWLAPPGPDALSAAQMQLWFEDARSDAVRMFLAHPAGLDLLGYGGIGAGGDAGPDGFVEPGFTRFGIGARDAWEPDAAPTIEAERETA